MYSKCILCMSLCVYALYYLKFLFHFLAEKTVQGNKYTCTTRIEVYSLLPAFLLGPATLWQKPTSFETHVLLELSMWYTSLSRSSQQDSLIHEFMAFPTHFSYFICAASPYISHSPGKDEHNCLLSSEFLVESGSQFFGFNIPFILLKIMVNTKELLLMWVIAIISLY